MSADVPIASRISFWAVTALVGLACLVIFLPLLLTVYLSVFDETIIVFPPRGYTLSWYGRIAAQFGPALWTSFRIAIAAVALSLLIGVPAGIGLHRYRFPGRDALNTFLLSPLTVPGIAIGLAIYVLAIWVEEQSGVTLAGSLRLLILAHVLICTPWVVRLCLAGLTNHERSIEEAAASLGGAAAGGDLAGDVAGDAAGDRGRRAVCLHHFV